MPLLLLSPQSTDDMYVFCVLCVNKKKTIALMGNGILFGIHVPDFPGGSDGKASVYNAEDSGSIPGSGRSAGGGNGNPLQYSCLENPMDRGAWWATGHGVAESGAPERRSCSCIHIPKSLKNYFLYVIALYIGLPRWHSGKKKPASQCKRRKRHIFSP